MSEIPSNWFGPRKAPSPDELGERHAIGQLATIYALGMDLRDYDFARSAFADDAVGMGKGGPEPIDEHLKNTYNMAASFQATQHVISNQYIDIDGDNATLWSYGVAHHKVTADSERDEIIAGVIYKDKCRKDKNGWLIIERSVSPLWIDMAPPRATGNS